MSLLNNDIDGPTYWSGELPVTSRYTFGIAGETFFRSLKEDGKLLGTFCPSCNRTYVPATSFCERCLGELKEWRDVGLEGKIYTYTVLFKNLDGTNLLHSEIIAFVKFGDGGIIHRIGEIKPEEIYIGMKVAALLKSKSKRTGSIHDILYFKPIEK